MAQARGRTAVLEQCSAKLGHKMHSDIMWSVKLWRYIGPKKLWIFYMLR